MVELALGSPDGAAVFLLLFAAIGIVLGLVIFAIAAFPGARRPQFRTFGAAPRMGAFLGVAVAAGIITVAWQSAFRDFYRIEIGDDTVRLQYMMPSRTIVLPRASISGIQKHVVPGKGGKRRIMLLTAQGTYFSGDLNRSAMEQAWEELSKYFPPRS